MLTQLDGNPCSDYVNASYIDVSRHSVTLFSFLLLLLKTKICFPLQGFTEKNKFIAAQGENGLGCVRPSAAQILVTPICFHRPKRRHGSGFLEDDMGTESSDRCHADKSERKEGSE